MTTGHKIRSQAGFGLIEILIALSLVLVAFSAVGQLLAANLKASKHIEIKGELEQIRQYVRSGLDCRKTLDPLPDPCVAGAGDNYIKAFRKVPASFAGPLPSLIDLYVPDTPTKFGLYFLRAGCFTEGGEKKLRIEVKRAYRAVGPSIEDPLIKTSSDWRDLFVGLPPLCSEFFGATVANPQIELQKASVAAGRPDETCAPMQAPVAGSDFKARPWSGTVSCRPGYYAVSAGAYVFLQPLKDAALHNFGGTLQAIEPTSPALEGFNQTICVYTKDIVPAGTTVPNVLWATCVRKD